MKWKTVYKNNQTSAGIQRHYMSARARSRLGDIVCLSIARRRQRTRKTERLNKRVNRQRRSEWTTNSSINLKRWNKEWGEARSEFFKFSTIFEFNCKSTVCDWNMRSSVIWLFLLLLLLVFFYNSNSPPLSRAPLNAFNVLNKINHSWLLLNSI